MNRLRLVTVTRTTDRPTTDVANRPRLVSVAGAAVAVMAGCTGAPSVPEWKDPAPAVTAAASAPIGSGGAAASVAVAAGPAPAIGLARPSGSAAPAESVPPAGIAAALDGRFVDAVRRQLPEIAMDLRDEEIIEMGGLACVVLAAGRPPGAVAEALTDYGLAATDARKLAALARSTRCPG